MMLNALIVLLLGLLLLGVEQFLANHELFVVFFNGFLELVVLLFDFLLLYFASSS